DALPILLGLGPPVPIADYPRYHYGNFLGCFRKNRYGYQNLYYRSSYAANGNRGYSCQFLRPKTAIEQHDGRLRNPYLFPHPRTLVLFCGNVYQIRQTPNPPHHSKPRLPLSFNSVQSGIAPVRIGTKPTRETSRSLNTQYSQPENN